MKHSIGTAVIGTGKVAHTHAAALATLPCSRFTAVYGRTPESVEAFARQYNVRAYTDLEAMLHQPDVEAVTVCTPHLQHASHAISAAEAGVHVLVEKPMAITLFECDRMLEAARWGGVKLGVISQRRWYEPVQRVKGAIEEGKIGVPILGTCTVLGWRGPEYYALDPWRGSWALEGGGVLVNQASHQLDLLLWLMGPVQELFGYWDNLNHPYLEVEDTAVAVVRFRSGALGSIVVSNAQNPGLYGRIHIHGYNGATVGAQTDGGSPFVSGVTITVEPPINDVWTVPGEEGQLPLWQQEDCQRAQAIDITRYYHRLQIEDFLRAIVEDREPLVNGEEGRAVVELFTAIYRSQRLGRPVAFPLNVAESL